MVGNDSQFRPPCAVLATPNSPTGASAAPERRNRVVQSKEIMAIFADLFPKKPVAYWLDQTGKAGVPSTRSTTLNRSSPIPTCGQHGMRIKVDHPFEKEVSLIRNPTDQRPARRSPDYRPPPLVDEKHRESAVVITSP